MQSRTASKLNGFFVLVGTALFCVLLLRADPHSIGDQLSAAGWALLPATALFVLNLCASTLSWRETVEPGTDGSRVGFAPLFAALWSGHAIDGVGLTTGGEVVKGSLLARRVPPEEAVAALVNYGFVNAATTVASTVIGPLAALAVLDLPRDVVVSILAASLIPVLAICWLRRMLLKGPADSMMRLVRRFGTSRTSDLERFELRARTVERRVREFRRRRPHAYRRALLWSSLAKALQAFEAWVLIDACIPGRDAGWLLVVALVSRSATLLIGWFTAFVPGRIGVAEGGTAALFELLGLGAGVGLTFAILRRARRVLVTSVGLAIAASYALRDRVAALTERESAGLVTDRSADAAWRDATSGTTARRT